VRAEVKALACELPSARGLPLSRFSTSEIARAAVAAGIVEQVSGATVWRWLSEDAIKPWQHRSWIFPRDPAFRAKAARVLELYEGRFEGKLLHPGDFVLSADEKPSIQARRRKHETAPAAPGRGQRVEHEYERKGALCYFAAWDVKRGRIFGRCEARSGIKPFDRLVSQVMGEEPYRSARRVFWIVDNGSSHRGRRSVERLAARWPKSPELILVHLPIHASWLNQVEIYFSIIQRKVLKPNDFSDLPAVEERLRAFEHHYEQIARPFEWTFTRHDLDRLLAKLSAREPILKLAA
jgi:transposase